MESFGKKYCPEIQEVLTNFISHWRKRRMRYSSHTRYLSLLYSKADNHLHHLTRHSAPLINLVISKSLAFPSSKVLHEGREALGPSIRQARILADESTREAYGMHYLDKRDKKSTICADFNRTRYPLALR